LISAIYTITETWERKFAFPTPEILLTAEKKAGNSWWHDRVKRNMGQLTGARDYAIFLLLNRSLDKESR
jgi:hypothetical protein